MDVFVIEPKDMFFGFYEDILEVSSPAWEWHIEENRWSVWDEELNSLQLLESVLE